MPDGGGHGNEMGTSQRSTASAMLLTNKGSEKRLHRFSGALSMRSDSILSVTNYR